MGKRKKAAILAIAFTAIVPAVFATLAAAQPFFGTSGDDVINGTPRHDYITGRKGNDNLNGLGRADVVRGGTGNDTVSGGLGRDFVVGGWGNDTVNGDEGADLVAAGPGVDVVNGGPGNDVLWALARVDVTGQPNEPADTLNGGPGNDLFFVRDGEPDTVDCGDGYDIVRADDKDVVAANCEFVKRHAPRPQEPKTDQ